MTESYIRKIIREELMRDKIVTLLEGDNIEAAIAEIMDSQDMTRDEAIDWITFDESQTDTDSDWEYLIGDLEKVGKYEPGYIDPNIDMRDWASAETTRNYDLLSADLVSWINAVPAAVAALGYADNSKGQGWENAKLQAKKLIGSAHRTDTEQVEAVYGSPYWRELQARSHDPGIQAGDYFIHGQIKDMSKVNAAFKAICPSKCSPVTAGVYHSGGIYVTTIFPKWEALTGGDISEHSNKRKEAIALALPYIEASEIAQHREGVAMDIVRTSKSKKILMKAAEISNIEDRVSISPETDHFHVSVKPK